MVHRRAASGVLVTLVVAALAWICVCTVGAAAWWAADPRGPERLIAPAFGVLGATSLLAALAAAGAGGRATAMARARLAPLRRRPPAALAETAAVVGLRGRLWFVEDDTAYLLTLGWRHPAVVVSRGATGLLPTAALVAALWHERSHCRYGDPGLLLLGAVAARALFLFPVAGRWLQRCRSSLELAADCAALRESRRVDIEQAMALLWRAQPARSAPAARELGWRLRQLRAYPRPLRGHRRAGGGVVALALAGLALAAAALPLVRHS